jgi:hypothetical protein
MRWAGTRRWEVRGGSAKRNEECSSGELKSLAWWIIAHRGIVVDMERPRRRRRAVDTAAERARWSGKDISEERGSEAVVARGRWRRPYAATERARVPWRG